MNTGANHQADVVRQAMFADMQAELREQPAPARRLDDVEDRFQRLLLVSEAMWTLLSERLGVTEDELVARMGEIDALDGQVDGRRVRRPPARCDQCRAAVDRARSTCAFCGAPAPPGSPFDRI